jgi:cytochrome c biogenesis protein CcmG, thiol:disulfide interchange protein DsbE
MTNRQQWIVVASLLVVLAGGAVALVHALGDELYPVDVGTRAPAFQARAIDGTGRVKQLADYRGQVVIVNVWATWCEPCKMEMPSLERLFQTYGPRGLKVVAVSVDETASDDSVRAYARNLGLSFEILRDNTGEVEKRYQITGYPETFVIGGDGLIRKKWLAAADWMSPGNVALVRTLLGLPAAPPGKGSAVGGEFPDL